MRIPKSDRAGRWRARQDQPWPALAELQELNGFGRAMSNRNRGALSATFNHHLRIQLTGEGRDNAGTEPSFGIARAHLLAPAVVGNRQRPFGFDHSTSHDDAAALHGIIECVLERIDDEFSDNQAEALGLLTAHVATLAADFQSRLAGRR